MLLELVVLSGRPSLAREPSPETPPHQPGASTAPGAGNWILLQSLCDEEEWSWPRTMILKAGQGMFTLGSGEKKLWLKADKHYYGGQMYGVL